MIQIMDCYMFGVKVIIWTNDDILLMCPLETNLNEIWIEIPHCTGTSTKTLFLRNCDMWPPGFHKDQKVVDSLLQWIAIDGSNI